MISTVFFVLGIVCYFGAFVIGGCNIIKPLSPVQERLMLIGIIFGLLGYHFQK